MRSSKPTKPFDLRQFIEKTLRAAFRRFPAWSQARNKAKEEYWIDGANGNRLRRVQFTCAECGRKFKSDAIAVDHIDPVGHFNGDWGEYIGVLFCDPSNLQVMCNYPKKDWDKYGGVESCHKRKSRLEAKERKDGKANASVGRDNPNATSRSNTGPGMDGRGVGKK